MRRYGIGLAAAGLLLWATPTLAQTMTANYTWTNPTDKATQIKVEVGSGSGCTATGCSTYAAAPGSPIPATATQFSQAGFAPGVPVCHRWTRQGGGNSDGDPVITCGTPIATTGKNGQVQNMILIFSPPAGSTGTMAPQAAPSQRAPAKPKPAAPGK